MAETGSSFIKKLIGFSLVTWISFALSSVSAPIATRLYSPEILGKINIFNTYSNLFGIFVLLGLDQAFARFYLEPPQNKSKSYLFTFCLSCSYTLQIIAFVLALPIQDVLSKLLFNESDNLVLWLFFGNVFCSSTLRYLNLCFRMEQDIKMYTIQGVLIAFFFKVFYIGAGFWDPSYRSTLIVLTVSNLLLVIVFLIIQRKRFEFIRSIDKVFVKELAFFATPLIPASILMWANSSIPQMVMQKTMDYYSIGIFTSAQALANMIFIIQAGFNTFWVPYTYENYKTQTGQFFKVHKYLIYVLVLCALLIVGFQDLIFLLLGEEYRTAREFFPFLILGPVCYIIGETTGIGINISKKSYLNLYVFFISVIVNLILCIILGKWFGITGIAMATSVAAISSMVLKSYLGEKQYHTIETYKYVLLAIIVLYIISFATLLIRDFYIRTIINLLLMFGYTLFSYREIKELCLYINNLIPRKQF